MADILENANSATVTAGGTTAPSALTSESWTVTTAAAWSSLTGGETLRVMDKADEGKTSGYEIMEVTAIASGTGVSWTVTRGVEGTTPYAHAANWTVIPVATAAGIASFVAGDVATETSRAETEEALLAPISSPVFSGTPEAPTPTTADNTTKLATTAFVQTAAGLLIPKSLVTTAGDLIVATGSAAVERLAKGTSGQVLTVGGSDPSGLEWATPSGGGDVSSFNSRTGAVVPASGDYTVGEVTGAQPMLTLNAVKTTTFSCSSNNFYPLDSTGGSFTATLVGAPPDGTVCAFKLVASASPANPVTIAASGSDVLNVAGTTTGTIKLTQEAQYWVYRAANATWYAESSTPVGQLETILAPLASPAFTATPTAPTAAPLTDDTQIATTAYTDAAVAASGAAAATAAALAAQTATNLFLSTQCS